MYLFRKQAGPKGPRRFESSRLRGGRLAQLVERFFDVEKVTGSNPVPPIIFPGASNCKYLRVL